MWIALRRAAMALLALAALAAVTGPPARAELVIAPNDLATVEGNRGNGFPFSQSTPTMRYHHVYAASEFASLDRPVLFTQIGLSPELALATALLNRLALVGTMALGATLIVSGRIGTLTHRFEGTQQAASAE